MPADHSVVDRRPTKQHQAASGAAPPEPEHLPCPRCDSINTKFCYYNNYNFSQPRHFCKACRRYWTHGGTLRDIPIGGGSRKNAKRSRTAVVGSAAPALDYHHVGTATPILIPFDHHVGPMQFLGDHVKGNAGNTCGGSFTSLLNTQGGPAGLLALGGFGMGIGPGFEDVGFGLGRTVWPFASGVGDGGGGAAVTTGGSGGGNVMANMWQLESGEGGGFMGGGGGDCFSLPADLAISTPGISNAMK